MQGRILIDEETGERFKVSPTAHASWFLTKIQPKSSTTAEKLGQLRKENEELRRKLNLTT